MDENDKVISVFPCLTWVKCGVSKIFPHRVKLDEKELKKVMQDTKGKYADSDKKGKKKIKVEGIKEEANDSDDDIAKKYGFDDYDDDDDDVNAVDTLLDDTNTMPYYGKGERDPYIKAANESDSDDEWEIKTTDNLLVAASVDDDAAVLYVSVYDQHDLIPHHEIILPSYPVCIEWLDFDPVKKCQGNFVAVGSMQSTIDIWDLDIVDSLDPTLTLGTPHISSVKKKKKSSDHGHTDAVLDLSRNQLSREHLASASADMTIGIWDLSHAKMATTIRSHSDKVQCIQWNPHDKHTLVSGSFDQTVKLHDGRKQGAEVMSWNLSGEIEKVYWDPFSPTHFFATTENGSLSYMDTRKTKPIYSIHAHDSPVIGLSVSTEVKDLIVTAASDCEVTVWDRAGGTPEKVATQSFPGTIHCIGCNPDAPFIFAIGGEKTPFVLNILKNDDVGEIFSAADLEIQKVKHQNKKTDTETTPQIKKKIKKKGKNKP